MSRPLRIEFAGAIYHVTSRGNERKAIYRCAADRQRFLAILADVVQHFRLLVHAYVLMDNHYHLLVETLEANLSRAMRKLNGNYAQWFNRAHRRVGHLVQGRYKALLVERDSYLIELSRYIHRNPVRAGIAATPEEYPWSSARAYVGRGDVPPYLTVCEVLGNFDGEPQRAQRLYTEFLRDGDGEPRSPLDNVVGQTLLGGSVWVQRMTEVLGGCISAGRIAVVESEQPAARKFRPRPTAAQVIATVADAKLGQDRIELTRPQARALTMYLLHRVADLSLNDVASIFGVQRAGASKAICRFEVALKQDTSVARLANTLRQVLEAGGVGSEPRRRAAKSNVQT